MATRFSVDITTACGDITTIVDALAPEIGLFGGRLRTSVLLAIRLLEQTWPSQLAELLEVRLFAVQRVLASLEAEGVIASRLVGRTRLVTLNPRYFAAKNLSALLWDLAVQDVPLQKQLAAWRPRSAGKPL